jgi:hypothetical protein
MLVGDFVEDYEVMVPFQALQMVGHRCVLPSTILKDIKPIAKKSVIIAPLTPLLTKLTPKTTMPSLFVRSSTL